MDGLESILRAHDVQPVGTASSAEEAVDRARELRPDVVLMDARLRDVDLKEATRLIRERSPGTRILFMLVHHEDIDAATEAGADGHVMKDSAREELIAAVRRVAGPGDDDPAESGIP